MVSTITHTNILILIKTCMKREPTQEERGKIVRAIAAGDRIGATSMYISITECGLTEAQNFIKALTTELQLENPEKFASEKQKERSALICVLACRSHLMADSKWHSFV